MVIGRNQKESQCEWQPHKPGDFDKVDQVQANRQQNRPDDRSCVSDLDKKHRRPRREKDALNVVIFIVMMRWRRSSLVRYSRFFSIARRRSALIAKVAVRV